MGCLHPSSIEGAPGSNATKPRNFPYGPLHAYSWTELVGEHPLGEVSCPPAGVE